MSRSNRRGCTLTEVLVVIANVLYGIGLSNCSYRKLYCHPTLSTRKQVVVLPGRKGQFTVKVEEVGVRLQSLEA